MDDSLTLKTRLGSAARRLTQEIIHANPVINPLVLGAFLNVPRHAFVPAFYRADGSGTYRRWDYNAATTGPWIDLIYRDSALVTEIDGRHADISPDGRVRGTFTSSSSEPSLMAAMLDALHLEPGMRVLEVGTGSGYNTALVSELVGTEGLVVSMDLHEHVTKAARLRLERTGYQASVIKGDGAAGYAPGAPYNRILCTAAVREIPRAWVEQTAPGALIVAPLALGSGAGALARLEAMPDGTVAGRLLHNPASFMPLRQQAVPGAANVVQDQPPLPQERSTELGPELLSRTDVGWFIGLCLPEIVVSRRLNAADEQVTLSSSDPAGSVTEVVGDGSGRHVVRYAQHDHWKSVEKAYHWWVDHHRPPREWFRLHGTPDELTASYTDGYGETHTWPLAAP